MISKDTKIGTTVWNSMFGYGEYLGISPINGDARVKFEDTECVMVLGFSSLTEVE